MQEVACKVHTGVNTLFVDPGTAGVSGDSTAREKEISSLGEGWVYGLPLEKNCSVPLAWCERASQKLPLRTRVGCQIDY